MSVTYSLSASVRSCLRTHRQHPGLAVRTNIVRRSAKHQSWEWIRRQNFGSCIRQHAGQLKAPASVGQGAKDTHGCILQHRSICRTSPALVILPRHKYLLITLVVQVERSFRCQSVCMDSYLRTTWPFTYAYGTLFHLDHIRSNMKVKIQVKFLRYVMKQQPWVHGQCRPHGKCIHCGRHLANETKLWQKFTLTKRCAKVVGETLIEGFIIIMFYYAIMAARTIQLNTDINTHNCTILSAA